MSKSRHTALRWTLNLGGDRNRGGPKRSQRGFTLTELMVAAALGAVIIAAQLTVYLHATRAHGALFRLNQEMENGRYAMQLLREDLWHAGYWGEYVPNTPATAAAPLCTSFGGWSPTDKINFIAQPVYGYNDGAGLPTTCDPVVANRVAGTDVLVIRRTDTCIADDGADKNCEDLSVDKPYLQVSLCNNDASGFVLNSDPDQSDPAPFDLHQKDASGISCDEPFYTETFAVKRKVLSNIYYIRNVNGIPTLMRSDLDFIPDPSAPGGGTIQQRPPVALVEGIEYMEVEYGIDADGDGAPDSFTNAPGSTAEWESVVSVKLHLLTRTLEQTHGYTDTKTYRLGSTSLGPFADGFYRRVFSAYIRLNNPAGRRES